MKKNLFSIGKKQVRVPIVQGGMGVGISLGRLAGTVAKEGGAGTISAAQIGFKEPDFYENPWTDEIQSRSLIVVTSLSNEPIEIQNISINRGGCSSQITQGAKKLSRYGSYTKFLLPNCDISMVKEAQLKLNNLEYVYNF